MRNHRAVNVLPLVVREVFKLVMGKASEQLSAVSARAPTEWLATCRKPPSLYDDAQPSSMRGNCRLMLF